jgi:dienelactone hydrolase
MEGAVMEQEEHVRIPAGEVVLSGDLVVPVDRRGVVLFAHGSGSSRLSPRNRHVAAVLRQGGLATVLMDLLTRDEETVDARTAHLRFDIAFLARRLAAATDWVQTKAETAGLPLGYFGASTGAAAALVAAAERPKAVRAIVSRGGRPDLAGPALARVQAPTLLIVGSLDRPVIEMNREAMARLTAEATLGSCRGPRTCSRSREHWTRWRGSPGHGSSGGSHGRVRRPRSAFAAFPPSPHRRSLTMPEKLFVGGLPFSVTEERLRETFAAFGTVQSAEIATGPDGRSRGFGFVEMATPEETETAMRALNGSALDGRTIRVEKSVGRGARARGTRAAGRPRA